MNCFAAKRRQKGSPGRQGVLPKPRSGVRRYPSARALGFVFVHVTAPKGQEICSICRRFAACVRSEIKPRAAALG